MLRKLAVAALLTAGLSTPALAQDKADKGWYIGARIGTASLNDPDFTVTDPSEGDKLATVLKTDSATAFSGETGYNFGHIRAGLEISYQSNKINGIDFRSINGIALTSSDVADIASALVDAGVVDPDALDSATLNGTVISGSVGKLEQAAVMVDLTYTLPVGDRIKPYVGVGFGEVANHVEFLGDDDGLVRTAWQFRAGADFKLASHIDLTADYTYRQTGAGDLQFGDNDLALHLGKTNTSLLMVGLHFGL